MLDELRRPPVPVHVINLSKHFDALKALDNVTLDFPAGSFFTLLGPSGCGKTTLLRIIAGFLDATSGEVWLDGANIVHKPPWKREIGFVFQNYALWPNMSVFDNVAYGLRLRRLSRDVIRQRVEAGLEQVGLVGLGSRFPGELSGGQQQRVSLVRALVLQPRVLLLDEPLSNLDARLRIEMRRELRRLQRDINVTTIYVTHDQEEALQMSDIIAVMNRGVVEQVGPPEEIYEEPQTPFVATFMGSVSMMEGTGTPDGDFRLADGSELPLGLELRLAGRRLTVGVRPENISVVSADEAGAIAGRVVSSSYLGHRRMSLIEVAPDVRLSVEHRERLTPDARVSVALGRYSVVEVAE